VLIAAHAPAPVRAEQEAESIGTRLAASTGRMDARASHRQSAPRK
jgi:universal stress protein A